MTNELRNKLLSDFPRLYRAPSIVTQWGFEIGDGWLEIVRELSVAIEAEAEKLGIDQQSDAWPRASQVKEKFGELCFYMSASGELCKSLSDTFRLAESKARQTCERCGNPTLKHRPMGVMQSLCSSCDQASQIVRSAKPRSKILFLDFDGVMHIDEVYLIKGKIVIADGHRLFEHAQFLVDALANHPDVKIVLSTSWVSVFSNFSRVRKYLPEELQERVIGACWHSHLDQYEWNLRTRFQQIKHYLDEQSVADQDWIAIDNDVEGWPDELRDHLVKTEDETGLGTVDAQNDLAQKLEKLVGVRKC